MLGIGPHSSFDFVFSVLVKRLAGNSISKMTYFCRVGCKTLTQSIVLTCFEVNILYSDFLLDTVYEMLPIYILVFSLLEMLLLCAWLILLDMFCLLFMCLSAFGHT